MPVMTEPKAKPMPTRVCLGSFTNDSERDLASLTTPGEVTLLLPLVDSGNAPTRGLQVTHYLARKYSRAKQEVVVVGEGAPLALATIFQNADADPDRIDLVTGKECEAADIADKVGTPALCLFWLPRLLSAKEVEQHFQAARMIADAGAAVIVVVPLVANGYGQDSKYHPQCAGASLDHLFHRTWLVIDKDAAPLNHGQSCNIVAPVFDPVAERGYTFSLEGGKTVFSFGGRTRGGRQLLKGSFPAIIPASHKVVQ